MDIHKKYSLVADHDKHFEIHDSTDGKRFRVAKKDIHPATQIKLMKMQKFAEGGDVEEETPIEPTQDVAPMSTAAVALPPEPMSQEAPPPMMPVADPGQYQSQMSPEHQQQLAQPVAPAATSEMPIAPSAPAAQPQAQGQYAAPGMNEMVQGLQTSAAAQQTASREQQAALKQAQVQEARAQEEYATKYKALDDEQAQLQKDVQEKTVDPRRYFHSMSTGQRIGTAVSLILGGIAAGLTGGPNLAMGMINKSVDDDIAAQKADLGKKESLLHTNLMKYGNLHAAEAATRLHYNTILQTQLQAAQAKATNGVAAGALQAQIGKYTAENDLYKKALADQSARAASLGVGSGEGGVALGQEPRSMLMDPKYRETRVEANGRAYTAVGKTEAEQMRRIQGIAEPVVNEIQRLRELSKDPMTKFAGTTANNEAHGTIGRISVMLPQLSGLTRINEVEIHNLLNGLSDPTRLDQGFGDVKNVKAIQGIEQDIESKRQQNLVGYNGMNSIKSFQPIGGAGGKLPLNK